METLLFIAVAIVIAIIENKAKKAKEQKQLPPTAPDESDSEYMEESQEQGQQAQPPRSLQDLIRQFENAQREAAQGNIEPPTPPVKPQHIPDQPVTFRDVAEAVIELDVVDAEYLMDEFNMSEGDALSAINELQKHRIIGRDMGDGECDVLVHDIDELDNLLNREKRVSMQQNVDEPVEPQESAAETEEVQQEPNALADELKRQRELNSLESRAKSARENAAAASGLEVANDNDDGTTPKPRRAPAVSTRSIADVRRGFIWAKVLDEPRFKRRWNAQYR